MTSTHKTKGRSYVNLRSQNVKWEECAPKQRTGFRVTIVLKGGEVIYNDRNSYQYAYDDCMMAKNNLPVISYAIHDKKQQQVVLAWDSED